ncbi:YraN family protein [Frigidibacter sp. MR17.24]|uniref:YraN family protein n=1 Tax=Frigidibacter sp. MR17.24 TaxID=3127345 RepID=UPI003012AB5F
MIAVERICGAGPEAAMPWLAARGGGTGAVGDRRDRGTLAHYRGLAAERQVEAAYLARGAEVIARRWRGTAGEIDLVLWIDGAYRFVEVKSSGSLDRAARLLGPGQCRRLGRAALEFLGGRPGGLGTDCAFDLALVDGQGQLQIRENVLWFDSLAPGGLAA